MCVISTNEVYRVGDIWESADGCKMKICRCTQFPNGTTSIQCQSECPPLPPNAHIPTARCPHPILIKPDGPCKCPYVSCEEAPPRRKWRNFDNVFCYCYFILVNFSWLSGRNLPNFEAMHLSLNKRNKNLKFFFEFSNLYYYLYKVYKYGLPGGVCNTTSSWAPDPEVMDVNFRPFIVSSVGAPTRCSHSKVNNLYRFMIE